MGRRRKGKGISCPEALVSGGIKMKRNGFTLLEILISLSLIGIILTTIYQAFSGHARAIEECRIIEDRFQIGRNVIEIISREIEGAYLDPEAPSCGFICIKGESSEGIAQDKLHFLTTSSFTTDRRWTEGGIREISYWITRDPESDEHILMRREDTTPDQDCQGGGKEDILTDGIKGMKFIIYDSEGREFEEWDSRVNKSLPVAVKVTIIVGRKDEEGISLSTLIPLPLSSGLKRGIARW
jgi:prepilin-type N-terminal cleavage/methylation domain-containing protein